MYKNKFTYCLSELALPILLLIELILCVYVGYEKAFITGVLKGLGIYAISALILIPADSFRIMIHEINHLDLFGPLPSYKKVPKKNFINFIKKSQ